MKRYCLSIVTVLLLFYTAQACEKRNTSIGGGETNWLTKCISDLDCGDDVSCECGICTKSCQSSDDCSEVPGAAGCLVTETLDDGRCRVAVVGESDRGICVARCEKDSDCNRDSDFKCISGVCTAILAEKPSDAADAGTIYGLVFPGSDAGVSSPLWLNQSDAADGSDIRPENTDAGDNATSDFAIDKSFPQCPCTADTEPGERAPTMAEYPDNAYGGPEWESAMQMTELCIGKGSREYMHPIDFQRFDYAERSYESRYQGLLDLCLFFVLCSSGCETDDECPQPDSGTAVARCSTEEMVTERSCYLDCGSQRICPDGMTCVHGVDYSGCFWAQDTAASGCPGHCELDPVPRDCPNFCASLFVACDPEKGVSCCEGLVCSEEGYCVQE